MRDSNLWRCVLRTGLLVATSLCASTPLSAADPVAGIHVQLDQPGPVVNRNIYGHFAEHLGRCIYEGFWVGEDSRHPQHPRHSQRCGGMP